MLHNFVKHFLKHKLYQKKRSMLDQNLNVASLSNVKLNVHTFLDQGLMQRKFLFHNSFLQP